MVRTLVAEEGVVERSSGGLGSRQRRGRLVVGSKEDGMRRAVSSVCRRRKSEVRGRGERGRDHVGDSTSFRGSHRWEGSPREKGRWRLNVEAELTLRRSAESGSPRDERSKRSRVEVSMMILCISYLSDATPKSRL